MKINNLCELKEIKNILEYRLKEKESWLNASRGHNYEEYCRRELIFHNDEIHQKLKKINEQIEQIINSI